MRIDKYLWCVRLFKTRSIATEQCKSGKILLNQELVKASRELKTGEIIFIKKNTAIFSYQILDFPSGRVGAALVKNYVNDITPQSEIEKYKNYVNAQRDFTKNAFGKPTKIDRRKLNRFLNSDQ